ncbi:response regulator receiver modulated diguanylate cyclase [Desulfonatronum thiosulfatophilum]|uniref:Response regulator receiver modulated diguanylate cyclase n=1 Tax=Desulfonatronum thiosulfatophilum TaxID=617002 RepID=A0A1G6A149_9BACT|nr:response regulator [Desulfonatronum thiosulfatophilum]SDB02127.1 response regulator receiver modulated diguanylate cyclase [Desulfonatronum thiosulfatophilum]
MSMKTVLIADDSPSNLQLLYTILSKSGYVVLVAENGAEVLEIIEEETPDIFLLDVMMPGMDGLELCRRIKQSGRFAATPIVFITAKNSSEDIVGGFSAGAVDYITKPFNEAEILARVQTHIRLHDVLLELERLRQLALDANPLTQLPGNNTILRAIRDALRSSQEVSVVYVDIDNFKAFNDKYGFAAGDQVLRFTANKLVTVVEEICGKGQMVGHVGGDDFVFIAPSHCTLDAVRLLIREFDHGIRSFYDTHDLEKAEIMVEDRTGNLRSFPLMSISLGVVELQLGVFKHHLEVASMCAEVKSMAKSISGSSFFVNRRERNKKSSPEREAGDWEREPDPDKPDLR